MSDVPEVSLVERLRRANARLREVVATLAAIRGADTDQSGTYTEDEFWLSRPELSHIQLFARARRAAPWAVLAVVLTRVVAGTSHLITIPPLIGGEVSLNIYIALVGKSGSGKDTAMAAGADAIRLNGVPFDEVTPGSGEGIAHAFMRHCKPHMAVDEHGRRRETTVEQYNTNALFIAAEIDSLAAMKNRNASTIMPELRRAWMGDRLGFQYVAPEKRMPMPKHCYRLCLMVGVQPDKAAPLLDDAAGGTPQRFIWVQVTDPTMPDARPAEPPPPLWVHPAAPNGRQQIDICARAKHEIDAAHLARCRGDGVMATPWTDTCCSASSRPPSHWRHSTAGSMSPTTTGGSPPPSWRTPIGFGTLS